MPVETPKVRKRFIALRNCQIGTGLGFLTLSQGHAYEADFKSIDNYNCMVGLKMIVENRADIKIDIKTNSDRAPIVLKSPVQSATNDTPAIKDLVTRISKVRTIKALNLLIGKLSPMELNSSSVQDAIVSIQNTISKTEKELVNG